MTKVFVHGNPETEAVWNDLVLALNERGVDDVVRLSPPGFGSPVPPDWDALPSSYVEWLAAELTELDGPIDLVGHDWGAGHVFGLAAARPDLIRSWAADCSGLLHPDYEWHDAAQGWQTPGDGEEAVEAMISLPKADLAAMYEGLGLSPNVADAMAHALDTTMGDCILKLYRGAKQPALAELGDRLASADRRPGLVIDATADAYVPSAFATPVADRLGADRLELADQGHWWMASVPGEAADGLIAFWKGL